MKAGNMNILNVKEVADLLRVKEKTLYQWAELGQIPHLKMNGSLRFDLDDIEGWIKDCKRQPESGYNPGAKLEARKGVKRSV